MTMAENRLYNVIALLRAFGAGSRRSAALYEALCRENMLDAPLDGLKKCAAADEKCRERISAVSAEEIKKIIEDCESAGIDIIPVFDARYPECLRNISVPPLALFIKGAFPDFDSEPTFCIVGPRKVSEFGRKAAYSLSRRLAKSGMVIVSGTAVGADTAAHEGAISASGRSVMVAADGIITQLESKNRAFVKRVIANGCIISENPPRDKAYKFSFPVRNRIMSGLSLGVAVIEAPDKSGALITAAHAAEQGKDVFVIPGNPADAAYKGSNALLRDGAIPLLDSSDIFTRYVAAFPEKIDIKKAFTEEKREKLKKSSQKKSVSGLSKEALLVYNSLVKPEFTVDDLSVSDIDGAMLLSALTELEFEHLITSLPGGKYKISNQ